MPTAALPVEQAEATGEKIELLTSAIGKRARSLGPQAGKLQRKPVPNPPEMWVRSANAFPAVVDPKLFARAQSAMEERAGRYTAEELLTLLRDLAQALDIDLGQVRGKAPLLDGIHPEVVELLKDRPIPAAALRHFRRVKPLRQIDMAQLMLSSDNYTCAYAQALIVGTPPAQLAGPKPASLVRGLSPEDITRMGNEMETLEGELRGFQDQFGENSLHLNAAHRYVKRLLENLRIERFLAQRYPEFLEEFKAVAALEAR